MKWESMLLHGSTYSLKTIYAFGFCLFATSFLDVARIMPLLIDVAKIWLVVNF